MSGLPLCRPWLLVLTGSWGGRGWGSLHRNQRPGRVEPEARDMPSPWAPTHPCAGDVQSRLVRQTGCGGRQRGVSAPECGVASWVWGSQVAGSMLMNSNVPLSGSPPRPPGLLQRDICNYRGGVLSLADCQLRESRATVPLGGVPRAQDPAGTQGAAQGGVAHVPGVQPRHPQQCPKDRRVQAGMLSEEPGPEGLAF